MFFQPTSSSMDRVFYFNVSHYSLRNEYIIIFRAHLHKETKSALLPNKRDHNEPVITIETDALDGFSPYKAYSNKYIPWGESYLYKYAHPSLQYNYSGRRTKELVFEEFSALIEHSASSHDTNSSQVFSRLAKVSNQYPWHEFAAKYFMSIVQKELGIDEEKLYTTSINNHIPTDIKEELIFVSYRSSNVKKARNIAEALLSLGYNIWFAEYNILLSRGEFVKDINDGISKCSKALLLIDNDYWKSEACIYECFHLQHKFNGTKNLMRINLEDWNHTRNHQFEDLNFQNEFQLALTDNLVNELIAKTEQFPSYTYTNSIMSLFIAMKENGIISTNSKLTNLFCYEK